MAAQHVSASCIIHYGRASLTPVDRSPAFFVFPKEEAIRGEPLQRKLAAEVAATLTASTALSSKKAVLFIFDQAYQHAQEGITAALRASFQVCEGKGCTCMGW